MPSFYSAERTCLLLLLCLRWRLVVLDAPVGTAIGEVSFLLARVADRRNSTSIGIRALLI